MLKKLFIPMICMLIVLGCGSKQPVSPNVNDSNQTLESAQIQPIDPTAVPTPTPVVNETIPGERLIARHLLSGFKVYAVYNATEKNDYVILKNRFGKVIRYEKIPGPGISHHGLTSIKIKSAKFNSTGTYAAIFVERITYNTNHAVIVYKSSGSKCFTFDRTASTLASGRLLQINTYSLSGSTINLTYQNYDYYYDQVKHQEHWILNSTINTLSQSVLAIE